MIPLPLLTASEMANPETSGEGNLNPIKQPGDVIHLYDDLTIKGEDENDIHPINMFKSCVAAIVTLALCVLFFYGCWELIVYTVKSFSLPGWAYNGLSGLGL